MDKTDIFEYRADVLPRITFSGRQDTSAKPWRNVRRVSEDYIFYFVAEGDISSDNAESQLCDIFQQSNQIIDYIGDYTYSFESTKNGMEEKIIDILSAKAANESINTNNPLLAVRNLDRSISFYLYMNGGLEKFIESR